MKSQFRAINRFITVLSPSSGIDWSSNTGTFQVTDTSVSWFSLPQWNFTYFITVDFSQTSKEEIFRIVNTTGDILTYDKRISVWGYVKPTHIAWASVRVNDVADILNEMSDNIDNFGKVAGIAGTQTVKVWGGIFNNGGTIYNVSTTTLAVAGGQLVDNTTNYIHFLLSTQTFSVTASSTLTGAVCMSSVVVTGWAIGVITDLRPGFATTYGEITTKLDKTGWLRDGMGLARQVIEIDVSWAEVKKAVTDGTSISGVDTLRKRKPDGTYEEITIWALQTALGVSVSSPIIEAWVVSWDPVGLIQDGLYKVQSEVNASNFATTPTNVWNIEKLSTTTYAVCYSTGGTLYAIICTVSWNTVTFGSAQTVGSAGSSVNWNMARIGNNKLAFVYMDTAAFFPTRPIFAVVGTVSGTTISFWAAVTVANPGTGWTWTSTLWSMCRIRDDAFAFQWYSIDGWWVVYGCTVTGTVPSVAVSLIWTYQNANLLYLADNRIVTCFPTSGSATWNIRMLEINPASLVITTTYTSAIGLASGNWGTIARFSDTQFVAGWYSAINDANIYLVSKPGAGTVLTTASVWTLSGTNQVLINIYDGIFGVHTGSSIIVMDGKVVLGTITWVAALPQPQSSLPIYSNGRLYFHSLTNLQSRIISLARVMYVGIATDSVWGFKPRYSFVTKTGVVAPYIYYLQTNGTIDTLWYTAGAVRIGKAIAANVLLLD